ncbi:MAG: FAD-dependent oxidoreductase [Planctomycetota bacterium]
MEPYDLICIGCGPAGEKAATQAAWFGHRVAIVERESSLGGAVVNSATIGSKALRETALLCSAFRRRPLPGWECPVDRKLSLAKLMTQRYRVQYQEHDRIEQSLDRAGITVHRGHGRIVDPETVSVEAIDGTRTTLKTKFILIATGSSPLRPDYIPFDQSRVVDGDEVLALDHVPDAIVVAGGGVIGCEYACMFAEIGVSVTLADPQAALLPFIDPECRDHLLRAMGDQGIDVRLNTSIIDVADEGASVRVRSDVGDEFRCDVLLWTAGRCSNTRDMGLEDLGVGLGPRGRIEVNGQYQTSVPNIYAAGDVIGFPALASTSMEQGRIAACRMFGIDFKPKLAATVPFGMYTIPALSGALPLQRAGADARRRAGHHEVRLRPADAPAPGHHDPGRSGRRAHSPRPVRDLPRRGHRRLHRRLLQLPVAERAVQVRRLQRAAGDCRRYRRRSGPGRLTRA